MRRVYGITVAAALLATVGSTLSVYPHQLAYFNELAGGPENGHRHLLHSNLDWGQDWILLVEALARLEETCGSSSGLSVAVDPGTVRSACTVLSMLRSAGFRGASTVAEQPLEGVVHVRGVSRVWDTPVREYDVRAGVFGIVLESRCRSQ